MWRRTYLFLLAVRLWFALSPSYLHPDENFQGPEVIAGEIFKYPVRLTWEFTSDHPIRSVFPLWPIYGLPMLLLRWLWIGNGNDGEVPPIAVFWTLRALMFVLSFVLEDWAIHELVQSPRHRRVAVLLVASSYVTWTYQTHTFSNAIETLVVAWSLVLIERTIAMPVNTLQTPLLAPALLGSMVVFGFFNRITFPAFLLIPGLRLIPYFWRRPLALIATVSSALFTAFVAISLDTAFYSSQQISWTDLIWHPIITPYNNLMYNISPSNLAQHGIHPWYQHILFNIPQLIGPAAILLFTRPHLSLRLYSAISGISVLSIFQHQEARFLLPTIPLILSSVRLPHQQKVLRIWTTTWIVFNLIFGTLMGIYHQGGIVPAQVFMSKQSDATRAIWWKTYMPPIWLLDGKAETLQTRDVMGMPGEDLYAELTSIATCDVPADRRNQEYKKETNGTYLIAPTSATWLDPYLENKGLEGLRFREKLPPPCIAELNQASVHPNGLPKPTCETRAVDLIQSLNRRTSPDNLNMAGFRLELFKFGMYLFFPIAFMGYFGVNLDERFAVPDFWPKPEEANKVPTERDEIKTELERLRARRLYLRDKRLAEEAREQAANPLQAPEQIHDQEPQVQPQQEKKSWWW